MDYFDPELGRINKGVGFNSVVWVFRALPAGVKERIPRESPNFRYWEVREEDPTRGNQ